MGSRIWFDITNTPQVHFLLAIEKMLIGLGYKSIFSTRDFSETIKLLEQKIGCNFEVIGEHKGKNNLKKLFGAVGRVYQIKKLNPLFDISITCGSESAIWYSFLKGKKSIAFGDNDLARQWTYSRFTNFCFFPLAIKSDVLTRQGIKKDKLYQYDGYKENVYLADFIPDTNFYSKIPFKEFIVVRPENLQANYIKRSKTKSIVPELLRLLIDKGENVIYLPRYDSDKKLSFKDDNLYVPDKPLNGIDLCYYANAVLTGAGTIAREAACLGTPSVSFFAGDNLLTVDKDLIKKRKMFYSRNITEILNYFLKSNKSTPNAAESIKVRDEVKAKLIEVINKLI